MNAARPVHTGFMDHGMRELWSKLGPMPEDLRLYGGTALALYLNHRSSTDFDFATPHGVVDTWLAANIKGVDPKDIESITGGPGMVDMTVQSRREIKMTLIECGALIPHPSATPRTAQNGVKVAHPLDLVMAKLCAIADRGRVRDLTDVAAAESAWPGIVRRAMRELASRTGYTVEKTARSLCAPGPEAEAELEAEDIELLRKTAEAAQTTKRSGAAKEDDHER